MRLRELIQEVASRVATLVLLCLLLSTAALAGRDCTGRIDPIYDFFGNHGGVGWSATALRDKNSTYCFERRLLLTGPSKQWINWPLGGIKNKVVVGTAVNNECCSIYPEPKSGPLEYGASGNSFTTKVVVGKDDLASVDTKSLPFKETWASTTRRLYDGDQFVNLNITVGSQVNAFGPTTEFIYYISNQGDEVFVDWSAVKSDFIQGLLKQKGITRVFLKSPEYWRMGDKLNQPAVLRNVVVLVRRAEKEAELAQLALNMFIPASSN